MLKPMETWGLDRGVRVKIIRGVCAGLTGTVQRNVHQKTIDCPGKFADVYHIVLDTGVLVTVRWDQVESVS